MYSYKRSWLTVVELSIIQCITKSLEICGSEIILSYCIVSWRPLITDTTLAWLSCLDLTWLEYIYLCLVHCRPAQLTEYAINGRQSWYGCHWRWYRVTTLSNRVCHQWETTLVWMPLTVIQSDIPWLDPVSFYKI